MGIDTHHVQGNDFIPSYLSRCTLTFSHGVLTVSKDMAYVIGSDGGCWKGHCDAISHHVT